jgi:hypothetical protein
MLLERLIVDEGLLIGLLIKKDAPFRRPFFMKVILIENCNQLQRMLL